MELLRGELPEEISKVLDREGLGDGERRQAGGSVAWLAFDAREPWAGVYWPQIGRYRMASSVALNEAQAHLPELLDRVERGEEIVIEREGRAGTKLVPVEAEAKPKQPRVFGQNLLGVTYVAPDIWDPMSEEELKEWGY